MKRRLLAGVLTLVMCGTMAMTAFAEDAVIRPGADDPFTPDPKEAQMTVGFNVNPTYTVTIPERIVLDENADGNYEQAATISAEAGMRLEEYYAVQVTMDSDYEMRAGSTVLPYTATVEDKDVEADLEGVVAWFETKEEAQSFEIVFAADNPEFAGDYKDTVDFTIEYVSSID